VRRRGRASSLGTARHGAISALAAEEEGTPLTGDGVGIEHRSDLRYDRISAEITNGVVTDARVA
jgi:hypothetical protein